MSKPLARYKDDQDLDRMLRDRERAEDPMLAFMQKKKSKQDTIAGKKGMINVNHSTKHLTLTFNYCLSYCNHF